MSRGKDGTKKPPTAKPAPQPASGPRASKKPVAVTQAKKSPAKAVAPKAGTSKAVTPKPVAAKPAVSQKSGPATKVSSSVGAKSATSKPPATSGAPSVKSSAAKGAAGKTPAGKSPAAKAPASAGAATKASARGRSAAPGAAFASAQARVAPQAEKIEAPKKLQREYRKWLERLIALRRTLIVEGERLGEEGFKALEQEVSVDHMADYGSDSYEQDTTLALIENKSDALRDVDEAIRRIEVRTYGLCEECEQLIPHGRLEILPHARYCVTCQAKREDVIPA